MVRAVIIISLAASNFRTILEEENMKKRNWVLVIRDSTGKTLYENRFFSLKQCKFVMAVNAHGLSSYNNFSIYKSVEVE